MREFFILLRMLTAFLLPRALQGLHTAQLEHIMVMGDLNVCPHITPAGYKKLEEDGFDLALCLQNDGTTTHQTLASLTAEHHGCLTTCCLSLDARQYCVRSYAHCPTLAVQCHSVACVTREV